MPSLASIASEVLRLVCLPERLIFCVGKLLLAPAGEPIWLAWQSTLLDVRAEIGRAHV